MHNKSHTQNNPGDAGVKERLKGTIETLAWSSPQAGALYHGIAALYLDLKLSVLK